MVPLEVQPTGRDHPEQTLQWRKRNACLVGLSQAGALPLNHLSFEGGRLAVGGGHHRLPKGSRPTRQVQYVGVIGGINGRDSGGGRSG
jgi:hypothetical protein